MTTPQDDAKIFNGFGEIAQQFCAVVDSARDLGRDELALKLYQLLPVLIGEAIHIPAVELNDGGRQTKNKTNRISQERWHEIYSLLKEKLDDWNLYSQVFDPKKDKEVEYGSLADDISDIYRDLEKVASFLPCDLERQNEILWEWRFGFYSHWGDHAMNALRTIHFLLGPTLS